MLQIYTSGELKIAPETVQNISVRCGLAGQHWDHAVLVVLIQALINSVLTSGGGAGDGSFPWIALADVESLMSTDC